MIKFEGISKIYEDGFQALKDINLHVKEGELLVLIGPSGCGKTTTMKMINRLIEPTSGKIYIDDKEIGNLDPVELRRNVGYVIQDIGLLPHMTIGENISIVPRLKKWDESKYNKRVDELLNLVGLDPDTYRDRYPNELSGGQQQRVGVVRALAADPPIVLMDEPFSSLDPISREQLQDELVKLENEINKTIVFVTHDMDEALKIADRICIMKAGEIIQVDKAEKILRRPANDFVRDFIGEERLNKANVLPPLEKLVYKAITAKPYQGLTEGIMKMRKHKVDSLLIVDKHDCLLGSVGVWDIQKNYKDEDLTLNDVMKTDIPEAKESQSLEEVTNLINKYNTSYLPVVNDSGKLKGVITRASLVEVFIEGYIK